VTFDEARAAAVKGARIKRAVWETWLRAWDDGRLTFLLPRELAAQLGTDYAPSDIDVRAGDWEAAP
jgi:hypothetical protein